MNINRWDYIGHLDTGLGVSRLFTLYTSDAIDTILTDGYFTGTRPSFEVGDQILVVSTATGTSQAYHISVTSLDGGVTVGQIVNPALASLNSSVSNLQTRVSALETNAGNTVSTLPGQIQFESASSSINEGGSITIRVNRVNGSDGEVSCVLTITGMTATTEYTSSPASGSTITFAAGETQKTITFSSVADSIAADDAAVLTLGTFQRSGSADSAIEGIRSTHTISVLDTGGGGTGTTYDYYVSASATSGAGTSADPWSMDQLLANDSIPAGSDILVRVATYSRAATNLRYLPAYNLSSSGTNGNPIRIFAEYYASDISPTSVNRCVLTTTGGNGPVIGSYQRDYVEWIGFYIDEASATPNGDSAPVVLWESVGCKVSKCRLYGISLASTSNHSAFRCENSSGFAIYNNYASGFYITGVNLFNGAAFLTYGCTNFSFYNNTIENCSAAVSLKGAVSPETFPMYGPALIYKNRFNSCNGGFNFVDVKENTGQYIDVYQNILYDTNANSSLFFRNSDGTSPKNIRIGNNLFYSSFGIIYVKPASGLSYSGIEIRNNIFVGNGTPEIVAVEGSLADTTNFGTWDYNRYHLVGNVSGSTTFATWQSTYNRDVNSTQGDPLFASAPSNLTLSGSSPCLKDGAADGVDFLNLRGSGTSATINLGPYVSDGQTEVIGIN